MNKNLFETCNQESAMNLILDKENAFQGRIL